MTTVKTKPTKRSGYIRLPQPLIDKAAAFAPEALAHPSKFTRSALVEYILDDWLVRDGDRQGPLHWLPHNGKDAGVYSVKVRDEQLLDVLNAIVGRTKLPRGWGATVEMAVSDWASRREMERSAKDGG